MTKSQQEFTINLALEPQKQPYKTPQLEHHAFLKLTGATLSIGLVAPDPFQILELQ